MANPFYNKPTNNGMSNFVQFMNSMRGKDPNAVIDSLVKSGKINQQQINVAQKKAKQMQSMFDGFRGMFGF